MAAFATYEDLEDHLRVTFSAAEQVQATALLENASDIIRAEAGQVFDVVANDTVTLDGNGQTVLALPELPVTAVTSVTLDGVLLVAGAGYIANLPRGLLYRTSTGLWYARGLTWGWKPQSIVVVYSHGYAVIPPELRVLCLEVAAGAWSTPAGAGTVQSESLGSFSRTYATGDESSSGLSLTAAQSDWLAKYRRPVFA